MSPETRVGPEHSPWYIDQTLRKSSFPLGKPSTPVTGSSGGLQKKSSCRKSHILQKSLFQGVIDQIIWLTDAQEINQQTATVKKQFGTMPKNKGSAGIRFWLKRYRHSVVRNAARVRLRSFHYNWRNGKRMNPPLTPSYV